MCICKRLVILERQNHELELNNSPEQLHSSLLLLLSKGCGFGGVFVFGFLGGFLVVWLVFGVLLFVVF